MLSGLAMNMHLQYQYHDNYIPEKWCCQRERCYEIRDEVESSNDIGGRELQDEPVDVKFIQ
jgi:hypothetical protein